MLREEVKMVKVLSRIIAKEEIAAIPKPDDPLKDIEPLIKGLIQRVQELEKKFQVLSTVSKDKKGR